jgi:hypothetical protein
LAGGGSLLCEFESSEKPNWAANSVGSCEWESLTENAATYIGKSFIYNLPVYFLVIYL